MCTCSDEPGNLRLALRRQIETPCARRPQQNSFRLQATICAVTIPPVHSRTADNGWRVRWVPY